MSSSLPKGTPTSLSVSRTFPHSFSLLSRFKCKLFKQLNAKADDSYSDLANTH